MSSIRIAAPAGALLLAFGLPAVSVASASAQSAEPSIELIRVIGEGDTPTGYESEIDSITSPDGAPDGSAVVTTENFVAADFVTVFLDVERDRFFGGAPGGKDVLLADETTRDGRFQQGMGSPHINTAGDLAYLATPTDNDLNQGTGGPNDAAFFRFANGSDAFFGAEGEAVPASYHLPGATSFRSLSVIDLGEHDDVYLRITYATDQTATLIAPDTSRDGQTGTRFDQALVRWDPDQDTVTPILKTGDTLDFGPNPDTTLLWNGIGIGSGGPTDVSTLSVRAVATDASGNASYAAVVDLEERANFGTASRINGAHFTNQLVIDGTAARFADGTLIQSRVVVPPAFGGDGTVAAIESIGSTALNAAGSWATVLGLGNPTENDGDDPFNTDVLIRDGELLYALGDTVDGVTLTASQQFRDVEINADGDLAFIFGNTLFFNGQVVAGVGTEFDIDEETRTLASLSGTLTLSDRLDLNGQESVVFNFLARDNTDETGTPFGDDLYTLTLTLPELLALAGDFNGNGAVEQGDLDLVLGNWGATTTPDTFVANTQGLTDGVDQDELDAVLGNWGASVGPSNGPNAVPEPGSIALLGLGAAAMRRRRK